jgi:hypothetical protein
MRRRWINDCDDSSSVLRAMSSQMVRSTGA